MRPRISEFSYGFALTRELIASKWNGLELTAAPFLPSLVQEGKSGGFDVALRSLNLLVFLQFKVSHLLTRTSAKGVSSGLLTPPYFRFDVHAPKTSDQHKLLCNLENASGTVPRLVRYAAPAFFTEGEFDRCYLNNDVASHSIFVSPSDIRLPDEKEHSVAFTGPTAQPVLLSKPLRLERTAGYGDFDRALRQTLRQTRAVPIDSRAVEMARDSLIAMVREMKPDAAPPLRGRPSSRVMVDRVPFAERLPVVQEELLRRIDPLEAIGRLAWTHCGCETVALGVAS